jgi:UDP-N-acetylglucosamine 4,6-dehydratase/5-epimerase
MIFNNKVILITGGTGSFGQKYVETLLKKFKPKKIIIFSRDELKQYEMAQQFSTENYPCLRYFIGDVRDKNRVLRACAGVDIIIHAAAMKHVTAAEYNPTECIATNISGAENIIDGAIANNVKKVLAISTDKAANPINLYGATKLCSDKLFVAANNLAGNHETRFSIVRYGNVLASRGSVIPFFSSLLKNGRKRLPLTHIDMTRFSISLEEGVKFVMDATKNMYGGEIFVPKLFSFKILDLITTMAGNNNFEIIGIRPGEKLHEVMIPREESLNCIDLGKYYIIQPMFYWWDTKNFKTYIGKKGKPVEKSFEYSSEKNTNWYTEKDLKKLLEKVL